MTCTNAYDTLTQADGVALENFVTVPTVELTTGGHLQANVTSYCRVSDGVWVAWFQNGQGDNLSTGTPKSEWPSNIASAVPIGVAYFPDDGSAAVVHQLGVDPVYSWDSIPLYSDADPCASLNLFGTSYADTLRSVLTGWSNVVMDVQIRTDGVNVWVIVLARETVDYPYLAGDGDTDRCGNDHPSLASFLAGEGGSAFAHDTSTGYRFWAHYGSAPDDTGPDNSFRWDPARVTVFAGDIAGFTKIDTLEAQVFNGGDWGLCSGIECAASEAEPGVLHVLWAEGGGRDSYQANYAQRINYSQWDTSSKLLDTDLFYAQEAWSGEGYLSDPLFLWTAEMVIRNDHGSPIAVVWPWVCDGGPQYVSAAGEFWDLSGGTANIVQIFDTSLAPTPAETSLTGPVVGYGLLISAADFLPRRSQYASSLYTDPTLANTDVYLFCVAFGNPGGHDAAAFYRIPCDGSDGFDYLDGLREVGYSIIPSNLPEIPAARFDSDFVSDPDDIWMPTGTIIEGGVLQLDRQCRRGWAVLEGFPIGDPALGYATADWAVGTNGVSPPSIITQDDSDWLVGGGIAIPAGTDPGLAITDRNPASIKAKICRCCEPCNRTGMHVWEII